MQGQGQRLLRSRYWTLIMVSMGNKMQMKFYCELYVSEYLEHKREKIIDSLKKNQIQPSLYVITLSQGEQNNLEFYSSLLYRQKICEKASILVVGVAAGYDDAMKLTGKIVADIYGKTKDGAVRSYIDNRQKEYEESGA